MNLRDLASPGLMLSQTWPRSRETEGETFRVLESSFESGEFDSFQSVEVPFTAEREQIRAFVKDTAVRYTYCIARVLNENGLSLSSLDDTLRKRSCDEVVRQVDHARQAGAGSMSFLSGPTPQRDDDRPKALLRLAESIAEIYRRIGDGPPVDLVIEPLDVRAHKKMSLGYSDEAAQLCRLVAAMGAEVKLCLDTAHILLNNERPGEALEVAGEYTSEYHYCNCVTDPDHKLYGDHHMRFGSPGVVDSHMIGRIMRDQYERGFFNAERKPAVMCEVLWRQGEDHAELAAYCAAVMKSGWKLAQSGNGAT